MSKHSELRKWMSDHKVTYAWAAEHLGITPEGLKKALDRDTISPEYHAALLQLRFPIEFLPPPGARPRGKRRVLPDWIEEEGRQV